MKQKQQGGKSKAPETVSDGHVVRREHAQNLTGERVDQLAEKARAGDHAAYDTLLLTVSAASAIGNQRVLAGLRERPGMPPGIQQALTLDLMVRSGNVEDATVERYLATSVPRPEIQKALLWIMTVRKSSFTRQGRPLPPELLRQMIIDVEFATREEIFTMARLLHVIDDTPDFMAVLRALRGSKTKRTLLVEHCCAMLMLQADLGIFATVQSRSESLGRRLVALFETGALAAVSTARLLLDAGYCFLQGGQPREVARILARMRSVAHEPAVQGLHANMLMALGDVPGAMKKVEEHVRTLFVRPPPPKASGGPFNTELAELVLKEANSVLRRAGLKPFIMSGTLLGYVREGRILKHDKDFDIGLLGWETQYAAAEALLTSRRFRVDAARLTGPDLFCIPVTHTYTNMSFDMFIYHEKADHYLHGIDFLVGYTLLFKWTKFGLQEVDFLGDKFYAPDNIEQNMEENYGPGWRLPDPHYHVKLEAPAIAHRASDMVNFLAHLDIAAAVYKRRDSAYLNRLADVCEQILTPGFRPSDDILAQLRKFQDKDAKGKT